MSALGCLLLVTLSMATVSIGPAAGEGWLPIQRRASGQAAKTPILIEGDGTNTVFHLGGRKEKVGWTAPAMPLAILDPTPDLIEEADTTTGFHKLLSEVEDRRATHYALFAVRPSGFATFNEFAYAFRRRDIEVGYEPIAEGRRVQLLKEQRP